MEGRTRRVLLGEAEVLENRAAAPAHRELVLRAPGVAAAARPGQFVHLLCGRPPGGDGIDRFLRRPLSVFRADGERGTVSVLFRVRGEGTRWLAERRPGEAVGILGPLGRGFPLPGDAGLRLGGGTGGAAGGGGRALLVGGGVGIPPLFFLARELVRRGVSVRVLLGARTAEQVLAEDAFGALGAPVAVATDDGSRGHRGLVTDLVEAALDERPGATVCACGPLPMLRTVQRLAAARGVAAYLSVEQTMACGVGACLGCPVRVVAAEVYPTGPEPWREVPRGAVLRDAYARLERAAAGEEPTAYRRVCVEGPVFAAWEVLLA